MTKQRKPPPDPAAALQHVLEEHAQLKEENTRLKEQNQALEAENARLLQERGALQAQITSMNAMRAPILRMLEAARSLEARLPSFEPKGARLDEPIWTVLNEAHMTHWAANGIQWNGVKTLRELVSPALLLRDPDEPGRNHAVCRPRRRMEINIALAPLGLHLGMSDAEVAAYEALFPAPKP